MKPVECLIIFLLILPTVSASEPTTFGGTINVSVAGTTVDAEPVKTTSPARGELSGKQFVLGSMNLEGYLNPFGGTVPKLSTYKDGQIRIGELVTGKPGSESEVYKVYLYGRHGDRNLHPSAKTGPKVGEYLMTRKQIEALMGGTALGRGGEELNNVNGRYTNAQDCSPMLGYASEADYRNDIATSLQQAPQTDVPQERFNPGVRGRESNPDQNASTWNPPPGNAPFATGTSTAVGDGTGIINTRENDPNASNGTPGCDVLTTDPDAPDHHPGTGYSKERLMTCIKNIQNHILEGVPQPIPTGNADELARLRNQIFSKLFLLPNQEQEFAAAIFTLDGEVGHHSRDKPMEGLMVLKVLQNRRDNANEIQSALQACRDNHADDAEARATCMGQANENSRFNLLDIALDRRQFSMYNEPAYDGNWFNKFGKKEDPQFTDAIDTFFNYGGMESWSTNKGTGIDPNKVYHYHTAPLRPGWYSEDLKMNWSGTHSTLGDLEPTSVHVFYENHDARFHGNNDPNADGWARNVRHEFRSFPTGD